MLNLTKLEFVAFDILRKKNIIYLRSLMLKYIFDMMNLENTIKKGNQASV